MSHHEKTAPAAATAETAKLNNDQTVRTDNDSRTSTDTGNRRRRPLTFHLTIREDDKVTETYCGKVFPKSGVIRRATSEVRDTPVECTKCRQMYELDKELKDLEARRRRAERITEMILRHLERGDE